MRKIWRTCVLMAALLPWSTPAWADAAPCGCSRAERPYPFPKRRAEETEDTGEAGETGHTGHTGDTSASAAAAGGATMAGMMLLVIRRRRRDDAGVR